MLQFSRSMGGTFGVSVMGAALTARLASNLNASGLDLSLVSQLLDPIPGSEGLIDSAARLAMANAVHVIFLIAFVTAVLALASVLFTPRTELKDQPAAPTPVVAD